MSKKEYLQQIFSKYGKFIFAFLFLYLFTWIGAYLTGRINGGRPPISIAILEFLGTSICLFLPSVFIFYDSFRRKMHYEGFVFWALLLNYYALIYYFIKVRKN